MTDEQKIFTIERPHSSLLTLYIIRSIMSGPFIVLVFPMFYFRYHTMRYRFDRDGISMRWGILFRREINLNYARIQDIHLTSGFIQRWLGLADLHIQTASGSAAAEMTIEGLKEFEMLRDYLYTRMRGYKGMEKKKIGGETAGEPVEGVASSAASGEVVALLREITAEVRAAREAVERRETGNG